MRVGGRGRRWRPLNPDSNFLGRPQRGIVNQNTRTSLGFLAFLSFAAVAPAILAAQQPSSDPFIWLEDVNGQKSMDWVNAHNASTVAELTASPVYQSIYNRTKAILDSKDRIAYPSIMGDGARCRCGRESRGSDVVVGRRRLLRSRESHLYGVALARRIGRE